MALELPHSPPSTPKLSPATAPPATPSQTPPLPTPPSASPSASDCASSTADLLVERLRQRARGHYERGSDDASGVQVSITPTALNEALSQLEQQYPDAWRSFQAKERFCYDTTSHLLTLRMPTKIHEAIIAALRRIIEGHVARAVQHNPEAARIWTRHVFFAGSATIAPAGARSQSRQCPDASWCYRSVVQPPFVLEVAWSETSKHVHHKCRQLIRDSRGQVRTALIVKCEYQMSTTQVPRPSISVFRYHLDLEDNTFDVVCNPKSVSMSPICLRLADFIPYAMTLESSHLQQLSDAIGDITISGESLAAAIEEAHELQVTNDVNHPSEAMRDARPKKRQRDADDSETDESHPASRSATTSFDAATEDAADPSYQPAKVRPIAVAPLRRNRSKRLRRHIRDSAEEQAEDDLVVRGQSLPAAPYRAEEPV
ncbi:hypothetical protein Slin15195_G130540 [Septoria linicola]|uniref:Uncharacterized protein n=1 Tax=Septoria linicola TaxID=215465 RepID=A0A9Q9B331_9PEZI|nr:hypothetical protein Slin15195_G130540 [Septoria linicola]